MVANFPWIVSGLVAVLALVLALRVALFARDRWRRAPQEVEPPAAKPAKAVAPGSPLQPAAQTEKPKEARQPAKPSPLQLAVADAPDLRWTYFNGNGQVQGDFGELVTSASLASQGWKQLPAKFGGGRGIDGLFVREVRGGGGFECLATETKTNNSAYDPSSMSDEKLRRNLEDLFGIEPAGRAMANELLRGLDQGSSFFRKELWRHDLANGLTTITELGRKGEKGRSVTRSNARLMGALYASLKNLDRGSVYVGQKPVDPDGDADGE